MLQKKKKIMQSLFKFLGFFLESLRYNSLENLQIAYFQRPIELSQQRESRANLMQKTLAR